jgi:hypothetical protein
LTGRTPRGQRPTSADAAFKSASQKCDREAEKFLGGDWHKARAEMIAVMPTRPSVARRGALVPL